MILIVNYSGKIFHEKDGGAEEANADLANQELLDISEEDIETVGDEIASNDSDVEGTPGEAVLTNGSAETTVAQAKVTREQVRAQNKETLQAIIDNTNLRKMKSTIEFLLTLRNSKKRITEVNNSYFECETVNYDLELLEKRFIELEKEINNTDFQISKLNSIEFETEL